MYFLQCSFSIRSKGISVWFELAGLYSLNDSFGAKTNTYRVSADVKRGGCYMAKNEAT